MLFPTLFPLFYKWEEAEASPELIIPHPKLGSSTQHGCAAAFIGMGGSGGIFGAERQRDTECPFVSVVHGVTMDILPPCIQAVIGWGRAVKSESRPPKNNSFIVYQ